MVALQGFAYYHQRREDLDNDYSGRSLNIASIMSMAFTSLVMALRFYAKSISGGRWGYDDGLIFVAWLINIGLCAVAILMVEFGGIGNHQRDLRTGQLEIWAKCLFAFETLYFIAVTLPKMSILCLYLRVFGWKGAMRRITQAILGIVVFLGFALCVVAIFQCQPTLAWWDKEISRDHCINEEKYFQGQAIPGFVLDLVIMALPLRTIWHLKLPKVKRLALIFVFVVASLGVIASAIRAGSFFRHGGSLRDSTWTGAVLTRWSVIEVGCYITANGLAHLRPLISRFAPPQVKEVLSRVVESASGRRSNTPGGWTSATPPEKQTMEKQAIDPRDSKALRVDKEYLLVSGTGKNDIVDPALPPPPSAKLSPPPPYRGSWEPNFSRKILSGKRRNPEGPQDRRSIQVTTEVSIHAQ